MQQCAIGFDFDHTLGIDNKLEHDAFVQLAQGRAAASGTNCDAARAGVAIDREIDRYRTGRCSLVQAIRLALDEVLGEGVDQQDAVDEFREIALALVPSHVQALPGVAELLTALVERGYRHAILSNGWNPLQQRKADRIGFDGPVFVSDDIGVRKPSVHAFNVLRDYFDLPAERIWYVGDDPRADVLGALNAGMKAMWFDWEHKKFPTDVPGPSAIIGAIGDALAYLE